LPLTRYKFGFDNTPSIEINTSVVLDNGLAKDRGKQATPSHDNILGKAQKEHDLAKAVKADNTEVPVHLWDEEVCRGPPTMEARKALDILRCFCLRIYCRHLWRKMRSLMVKKYGKD
jgi:hypothetical protein